MKKQTAQTLIIGLIFLQLYSLTQIISLQRSIENTNSKINYMVNEINTIYSNIDNKLEVQASLIHSADLRVDKLDVNTLMVPITFTVEPKMVTQTMSVYLDFDGEILNLNKSELKYSGSKSFKIPDKVFPKIIIEDNGVKSVEEYERLNLYEIKDEVFPYISAFFSGDSFYRSDEYHEQGILSIDYKPSLANNELVNIKYVVKVDGDVVKEMPVMLEGNIFNVEINNSYPVDEGQTIISYLVATDSLGFVHECLLEHFVAGSNMQREPYFEELKITAPNGEIVYMFDVIN